MIGRWRALLIAVFCLECALVALAVVYRAGFLVELNINEGWNAYYVDALLHGRPLYPPPSALITNNYLPLGFAVVAAVARLTGDALFAGRAVSIAALLAASGGLYAIARTLGTGRWPALLAALAYWATMGRLFDDHVGVNDPQLLGNALTTLGFLMFLRAREAPGSWFVPSALLMAGAGFVKPFLFAAPVSAFVILLLEDRRAALRFAMVGGSIALAGLGLCRLTFGADFAANVFSGRPYTIWRGLKALESLGKLWPPLIAWLVCLRTTQDGERRRIVNILCLCAALEAFLVRGADQVDDNAGFDFVMATYVALAVALDQFGDRLPPRPWPALRADELVIVALGVRLLFGGQHDAFNALYNPAWRRGLETAEAATKSEVRRVARIPGPVFCESTLVCYLAGKPFVVDPVNVRLRMASGALPPDVLDRRYRARQLSYVPSNPKAVFARR